MNYSDYILDEALAFGPSRTAVRYLDQTMSFSELEDRAARFAGLLAELGAKKGDRVVLLMDNNPYHYVALLGAARVGVICAVINSEYGVPEIGHMIRHVEPICIVTDAAGMVKYRAVPDQAQRVPVLQVDLPLDDPSSLPGRIAASQRHPVVDMQPTDGALLVFSSGSSGMPKPILTCHGGEVFAARSFSAVWRLNCNDRVLVALPLGWVYGFGTYSMPTLMSGAQITLLPRFRPSDVCAAIERDRITVFAGVTTMYKIINEYAAAQPTPPDLHSLRMAMTGGEKRNEVVFRKFETLSGVPVHDLFALSEIRPVFGYDTAIDPVPVAGSVGKLFPNVEAEIRSTAGEVLGDNEVGELFLRSPNTFLEYYRQPELTSARITPDGWVRTGDIFKRDAEGFYYIIGRKESDVINRGGVKISISELEDHIARHSAVDGVVVVGRPHERFGEEVVACVVGRLTQDEVLDELRAHFATHFAEHKIPTAAFVLDAFPTNPSGKIDRKRISEDVTSRSVSKPQP